MKILTSSLLSDSRSRVAVGSNNARFADGSLSMLHVSKVVFLLIIIGYSNKTNKITKTKKLFCEFHEYIIDI